MEKEIKELQDKLNALKLKYEQSKQPLKDGDVVKYNRTNAIYKIVSIENDIAYGLTWSGRWSTNTGWNIKGNLKYLKLATESEWLEVCKNEAVKRGLVEGAYANLSTINHKFRKKVKFNNNNYILKEDGLILYNFIIMQDGIWAEVMKDKTLEELLCGWGNKDILIGEITNNKEAYIKAINNLQNQK